jgi:DNA helicase-2/ATP-dependent DNA helicase PcrA
MQNNAIIDDDHFDDHVDDEIHTYLNLDEPKSFFLFAGAGSGKTRSLVNALLSVRKESRQRLRLNSHRIAVITYTNAACDEIKRRIDFDPLFSVSTIHSFVWDLIKYYQTDIKQWLQINLKAEIAELEQINGRPGTKTAMDRAKKIEAKKKRLGNLGKIKRFTYNPNGGNTSRDSLNHSKVINIGAVFLTNKPLMQNILTRKFPILLIDESQDANKLLMDAFFIVQKEHSNHFSLGLFGDTMQRIYADGKIDLGENLPDDWAKPAKIMNHRCPHRIMKLINKIRFEVDGQEQKGRKDKVEGVVRLFILSADTADKIMAENDVVQKMADITGDMRWIGADSDVKILTLEHHMAANRMGFIELLEPLYQIDRFRTGLLNGTLPGLRFFTQLILPLVKAKQNSDEFGVARIVRQSSPYLSKDSLKSNDYQLGIIQKARDSVNKLMSLWENVNSPRFIDVLQNVAQTGLFAIPESLIPIANRTSGEQDFAESPEANQSEEGADKDDELDAWDKALKTPFAQIKAYNEYVSDRAKFGTHQGVKGLEFPRVMVVMDDSEARGFMFSYGKLFGAKEPTSTDLKNKQEGKETSFDRTRRLFYVTCSRAKNSLTIVAYTENPDKVNKFVLSKDWFKGDEVILPFKDG